MTRMVVILSGGLGNQLFQFFAGLNYARRTGIALLELRTGFFASDFEPRRFDLFQCVDLERVKNRFPGIDVIVRASKWDRTMFRLANRLPRPIAIRMSVNNDVTCQEYSVRSRLHVGYKQHLGNLPDRVEVSQCFHSPASREGFDIGIHVRRGDYRKQEFSSYGLVDFESVRDLVSRFDCSRKKVLICSDSDIKAEFLSVFSNKHDFTFSSDFKNSAVEEFQLLRSCPTLICSNSTFSWWAGFSSPEAHTIFLPDHWYKYIRTPERLLFPGVEQFPVALL
jgi:hypothetical protein